MVRNSRALLRSGRIELRRFGSFGRFWRYPWAQRSATREDMDGLKNALQVINEMVADGIIQKYAVAGAVAALNYIEPTARFAGNVVKVLRADGNTRLR